MVLRNCTLFSQIDQNWCNLVNSSIGCLIWKMLSPNKDICNLFSLEFDSKFLLQLSKSESFLAIIQVSGKNSDTQDGIFSSAETTKLVIELHFPPLKGEFLWESLHLIQYKILFTGLKLHLVMLNKLLSYTTNTLRCI